MICVTVSFFFFNDTATTQIYTYGHTLALHDALPIFLRGDALGTLRALEVEGEVAAGPAIEGRPVHAHQFLHQGIRSEEHTSELQSLMRNSYAVFCLKKK